MEYKINNPNFNINVEGKAINKAFMKAVIESEKNANKKHKESMKVLNDIKSLLKKK